MSSPPSTKRFRLETPYGTNRGGWYRDTTSGDRKYVKMYRDPDQTRVEALTNHIYGALGVPAPNSELHQIDGNLAVVSSEVPGISDLSFTEIARHPEVMGNFITDAWLGNYDVLGLAGDNVVMDPTGIIHRIDNGGSMQFRARGRIKDFPKHTVPELHNMRDPAVVPMSNPSIAQSTAGRVFHTLTEADIALQAATLAETLPLDALPDFVGAVGFDHEVHDFVLSALVGRYAYLLDRYDIS